MNELTSALEGVQGERDFYFSKLRDVEMLCHDHNEENASLVQQILEVLYASDEKVSHLLTHHFSPLITINESAYFLLVVK